MKYWNSFGMLFYGTKIILLVHKAVICATFLFTTWAVIQTIIFLLDVMVFYKQCHKD